jgi:hypothetical protein
MKPLSFYSAVSPMVCLKKFGSHDPRLWGGGMIMDHIQASIQFPHLVSGNLQEYNG